MTGAWLSVEPSAYAPAAPAAAPTPSRRIGATAQVCHAGHHAIDARSAAQAPVHHRAQHHQQWLEEQPNAAGQVGVQSEGGAVGDELRHVAGEDEDEQRGDGPADLARRRRTTRTATPRTISTTPEATMTKVALSGSHGGTWA